MGVAIWLNSFLKKTIVRRGYSSVPLPLYSIVTDNAVIHIYMKSLNINMVLLKWLRIKKK